MSASTLNGRDSKIIPKMLLPPTINRFAPLVHQLGTQSIDHPTDNIHFQAVSVLSVLRSDTDNLKNIRKKSG